MTGPVILRALRRFWPDWVAGTLALALLIRGWRDRADPALDPHLWPGYLLGLGGSLMMLGTVGFSWRKRRRAGRGAVGWWYNAHVLLGTFGAIAVLIHARFGWGSINSGFALAATLLVVASGLVARYALGPARRRGIVLAESWYYGHVPLSVVLVFAVLLHVYMAHAY